MLRIEGCPSMAREGWHVMRFTPIVTASHGRTRFTRAFEGEVITMRRSRNPDMCKRARAEVKGFSSGSRGISPHTYSIVW